MLYKQQLHSQLFRFLQTSISPVREISMTRWTV